MDFATSVYLFAVSAAPSLTFSIIQVQSSGIYEPWFATAELVRHSDIATR